MATRKSPTPIHVAASVAETVAEPTTESIIALSLPAPPAMVEDPIDEAARLVERLNALREQAHTITLQKVHELLAKLQTLGFRYELVDTASVPQSAAKRPSGGSRKSAASENANFKSARECQYCKMIGHDGRLHRGQTQKRKFTPTELAALGVQIPEGF